MRARCHSVVLSNVVASCRVSWFARPAPSCAIAFAALALAKIEEEFWETKKGVELQRDRVEKSFAEFITHVPASALTDSGLRRHYKEPEALRTLRLLKIEKSSQRAEATA